MSKESNTDWKQLATMKDKEIDLSDIAELDEDFFRQAKIHVPPKKSVTMRLDSDVIEFFKSQGQGYQTRINKLLRNYMDVQLHHVAHRK
ncbi:MAG: 3-oxoacyl-ACP synthase [Gammaproteobacteria bacterium]|nr:MAG: 3-oxoacyl-ACP synthase [Gammaproteobacteria bacterium]